MRYLYIKFISFLRELFAEPVELITEGEPITVTEKEEETPASEPEKKELTVVSVDGTVMVNDVTLDMDVKQGDKVVHYRRTPKRTPKFDIKIGKTTFYAWGKGEVYTTSLEGENIPVVTNPAEDYTLVGYGTIL